MFDFDGVIANSEPLHFRAFRDVLAAEDIALTEAEYYERYLGYNDERAFREIGAERGRDWNERAVADLIARKAHITEELERQGSVLFPGAREAIERLAGCVRWPSPPGPCGRRSSACSQRERLAGSFRDDCRRPTTAAPASRRRIPTCAPSSALPAQPHRRPR